MVEDVPTPRRYDPDAGSACGPGYGEGGGRSPAGQDHRQAQDGEDAAPHHAADADGDRSEKPHFVLFPLFSRHMNLNVSRIDQLPDVWE